MRLSFFFFRYLHSQNEYFLRRNESLQERNRAWVGVEQTFENAQANEVRTPDAIATATVVIVGGGDWAWTNNDLIDYYYMTRRNAEVQVARARARRIIGLKTQRPAVMCTTTTRQLTRFPSIARAAHTHGRSGNTITAYDNNRSIIYYTYSVRTSSVCSMRLTRGAHWATRTRHVPRRSQHPVGRRNRGAFACARVVIPRTTRDGRPFRGTTRRETAARDVRHTGINEARIS